MDDDQSRLHDLVDAVADGRDLDWDALEQAAPDESMRRALRDLRIVAGVSALHASQGEQPAAVAASETPLDVGSGSSRPPVPPHAVSTAGDLQHGDHWGNFRIVRKVSEGAYGQVYEAIDTFLDHRVALKLLRPGVTLREAKLLVNVRHANVVAVHGAAVHDGRPGFWMDYIEGRTLAEIIESEGDRSADEACVIGQHLCRALAAVHAGGVIHRDIKPQNVMREARGGRIVLVDFGAGELMDPSALKSDPAGTPLYLAPELFDGRPATRQSDIYALGVLLFYLVTRQFPVEADTLRELERAHREGKRSRRLADERPDLPDGFVRVVETMLSADPRRRYESVTTAREALESTGSVLDDGNGKKWSPAWVLALTAAAASVAGIGILGFVACRAFELVFAIDGEFSAGPRDYLVVGLQAFFPFAVYWVPAAAVAGILRMLIYSPAGRPLRAALRRLNSMEPANVAILMFVIAMAGGAAILAAHVPLFTALDALRHGDPLDAEALKILSPASHDLHRRLGTYAAAWSFVLLLAVSAWFPWLEHRSGRDPVVSSLKWATLAVALLTVAVAALPRRIIWDSFGTATLGSDSAYVLSQRGNELLLYVPGAAGDISRRVDLRDATLRRGASRRPLFESANKR